MSVDLNPHVQLGFPRPLTQLVKRSLQVSNPNNQPVAFKVKTTAPKQYCVRPNSGRIEPGEKIEVQVLLQPMKEEPPTSAKCRDKFLVQSTIITPERETTSLNDIWGLVEKEDKSAIYEQKIRCAFLPATSASVPEEGEDANSSFSANDKYSTVSNGFQNPVAAAQNASAETDGATTDKARNAAVAAGGAAAASAGAAFAATKSAGSRAVGGAGQSNSSNGALSEKSRSDLESEVKRLQSQVATLKTNNGQSTGEGVPLHIVAAICFGVFAFTYVFL